MAKHKKSRPSISSSSIQASQETSEAIHESHSAIDGLPSLRMQLSISLAIAFHFCALLIAFSANLAPSYLQGQLTAWLSPYAITTNQAYNAFSLELTHAEPLDFPLYVELLPVNQQDGKQSEEWQKMLLPGSSSRKFASHDVRWSRWSNLSRVIQLIAIEQPDSEILSDIAARLVVIAEEQTGNSFRAVRLITPRVLSYDQDARVFSGASSLEDDELSPTVVYRATIVRDSTSRISLVPDEIPLRTAKPVVGQSERP